MRGASPIKHTPPTPELVHWDCDYAIRHITMGLSAPQAFNLARSIADQYQPPPEVQPSKYVRDPGMVGLGEGEGLELIELIKAQRAKQGLKIPELAERAGVHAATLRRCLTGNSKAIHRAKLRAITDALGIDHEQI